MKPAKDIYNPSQKNEYIEYEGKNTKALKNYFARIGEHEEACGKDIADMNADELKKTIGSLGIRREESIGHIISLLRGYINWARLYKKTGGSSAIDFIASESIDNKEATKSQMIKNPEQLDEIMEAANKYEYQENREIRDKLIIWLLYLGVSMEELQSLTKDSIDKNGTIVTSIKKTYKADEKIMTLWQECAQLTYIEKDGSRFNKDLIKYNLVDNDYLFRPIAGQKADWTKQCSKIFFINIISNIFRKYNEYTGGHMLVSPLQIKYSGMFYRLYVEEQGGKAITPEVMANYMGIAYSNSNELHIKTRKWRKDYENWKIAFGHM